MARGRRICCRPVATTLLTLELLGVLIEVVRGRHLIALLIAVLLSPATFLLISGRALRRTPTTTRTLVLAIGGSLGLAGWVLPGLIFLLLTSLLSPPPLLVTETVGMTALLAATPLALFCFYRRLAKGEA